LFFRMASSAHVMAYAALAIPACAARACARVHHRVHVEKGQAEETLGCPPHPPHARTYTRMRPHTRIPTHAPCRSCPRRSSAAAAPAHPSRSRRVGVPAQAGLCVREVCVGTYARYAPSTTQTTRANSRWYTQHC
jgi:hypothetical protein